MCRPPYRPAGESFQGERLHIISLMTRLPENNFGPLALLNVYAAGTDMVTRVPVERFDIDLYYMADKHGALGMGLSYTCHGAFCTENESTTLTTSSSILGGAFFIVSSALNWLGELRESSPASAHPS